jgi:uncharacterized protein YndB with AHSA1/START domain
MNPKTFSIKLKYVIYASPEKVFEALTKSSVINKWSGGTGKVSDKIDGDVEMFDGWVKGKVILFKPGKKLSYTWKPSEWDKKTLPSLVTYTLSDHKAGTEILLEHTGFPTAEEAQKHKDGWINFVFEPLNDYFTY